MATTVTPPTLSKLAAQIGAERTLYFTWSWDSAHLKQTDHFEVWWEYTTGNGVKKKVKGKNGKTTTTTVYTWFNGSEGSENANQRIATYSYPANATKVRVRLKPVAKQNEAKQKPYWTCGYSKIVSYTVPKQTGIAGPIFKGGVSGLTIEMERNSEDTVHAYWKWTKSYTDYFQVRWIYNDGTQIDSSHARYYTGIIDEVPYDGGGDANHTWTAPDNAKRVGVYVKPISKIAQETDDVVRYHWIAETRDKNMLLPRAESPQNWKDTGLPANVSVVLQNGTGRKFVATWSWGQSKTDYYDIYWDYRVGNQWFEGTRATSKYKNSTYDMPDNATKVRFKARPVCKKDSNGKIDWIISYDAVPWVESPTIPAADNNAVSDFSIVPEIASESSYIATWAWAYASSTDHYEVEWRYSIGQSKPGGGIIYLDGSTASVKTEASTYSPPSNATEVICRVLPVAVGGQWTAAYSPYVSWKVSDNYASASGLTKTVTMIPIEPQRGTPRTLVAQWTWSTEDGQTDHYDVEWQYLINDALWVRESVRSTSSSEITYDLYNVPDKIKQARVRVKPVAKTKKLQGIDTPYWTASYCDYVYYKFSDEGEEAAEPPVPQTPSVYISGTTLTASVNIYDTGAHIIEFEIVKDDAASFNTSRAKVLFAHAEISVPVAIGGEYKVRARSLRVIGKDTVDSVLADATTANSERSAWSEYSDNVGTIPATPTEILSHTVISESMVHLKWTEVLNITGYKLEYALNPDYFDKSDQVTKKDVPASAGAEFTVDGLDAGHKYFFRVCAVNNNGDSGWSSIYSFILGTAPSAPTTWSDTTKGVIGDDIYLYWTHNSEDDSSQSDAEVELTINGKTSIVEPTYSSEGNGPSYYIFDSIIFDTNVLVDDSESMVVDSNSDPIRAVSTSLYPEGSALIWRVRTKGILNEWSPWSVQRIVTIYSEPTVQLYVGNKEEHNDFAYEITQYPIYIYAEALPRTQQALGYFVTIIANESYETLDKIGNSVSIRDQQTVFSKYYNATDGNVLDTSLLPGDVNLDNGITYTITVKAAMNSGLTGSSSWTFAARWNEGFYTPDAEVTINPKLLCAYIRPYCMTELGEFVSDTLLSVYRLEYDGRYVPIIEDLSNGGATVVDPHPSLNYARYRVVATNQITGEVSFRDIPGIFVGETSIVIQWNEEWKSFSFDETVIEEEYADPVYSGSTLKLPYNVEISDSTDIDTALNEYIGRSHPVSYYGTQLGVKGSWNAVIPRDDAERLYALRRLAIYRGDVYVREPSGVGYWANINVSFSKRYSEMTIPVSLNVTRVEGGM